MKLRGEIANLSVVVMIDSGANHNFISKRLVKLGLKVNPTNPFAVRPSNGHSKIAQGCCIELSLKLGSVLIIADFHWFELRGVDVILGVAWLATLGKVQVDGNKLTMEFNYEG